MDRSVFDDIRWEIEDADARSLERFCNDNEGPGEIRARVEAYILERFDNYARARLKGVRDVSDIEGYAEWLKSWHDDFLPRLERDFRPRVPKAILRMIVKAFGTTEGKIIGSIDRGKLAGRFAHWRAEAISQARKSPTGSETKQKPLIARLSKPARDRINTATALFLAEFISRVEREANKGRPIHDAELLRDLVTYQFNLVALECMAVSVSTQEFEAELDYGIAQFVRHSLKQHQWLTKPMRNELETGFAAFIVRLNLRANIPQKGRAPVWNPGAITADALFDAALKLRAEAQRHAKEGGFPVSKQADAAELSGTEPTCTDMGSAVNPGALRITSESSSGEKKRRGRPPIPDDRKTAAAERKKSGGTNRQAAELIYNTKRPTEQQVKNVPAILKHHQGKSEKRVPQGPL